MKGLDSLGQTAVPPRHRPSLRVVVWRLLGPLQRDRWQTKTVDGRGLRHCLGDERCSSCGEMLEHESKGSPMGTNPSPPLRRTTTPSVMRTSSGLQPHFVSAARTLCRPFRRHDRACPVGDTAEARLTTSPSTRLDQLPHSRRACRQGPWWHTPVRCGACCGGTRMTPRMRVLLRRVMSPSVRARAAPTLRRTARPESGLRSKPNARAGRPQPGSKADRANVTCSATMPFPWPVA
jgi:hypothetical protein